MVGRRGGPRKKRGENPTYSQRPERALNEAQEAFAQYLATPDPVTGAIRAKIDCYALAYPNANRRTADKRSVSLSKMPAVVRRVAEIREKRFAKLEISAEWITEQFLKRYRTNVADYWKTIEVDKQGKEYPLGEAPEGVQTELRQIHKRLDELTAEQLEVLDGFTQETTARGGTKTKFEHGKKDALEALARGNGYFKDKVDVTSGGKPINAIALMGLDQLSLDDLDERIRRIESREAEAPLSD